MRRTALTIVMLTLVAAACGGDEPAPAETGGTATGTTGATGATGGSSCDDQTGADVFTVELADFEIVPSCLVVTGDQSSEVTNTGNASHTFTVTDTGIDVEVAPGETAGLEATGLDPGTYEAHCRFHPSMVTELRVE